MAFKMKGYSAFTKPTETNPGGGKRQNTNKTTEEGTGMSTSKQSSVWSDKATRLVKKRKKKQEKGKSTEKVQKKINKELMKLKIKKGKSENNSYPDEESPLDKKQDNDWMNINHRDHDKMMKIMIEKKNKDGKFVDPKTGKPWKRGVGSHAYKY